MRRVRMLLVLMGVAALAFSVAACGGDDGDGDDDGDVAAEGTVVEVELGESGSAYYVEPAQTTVEAGTVTFAVTNMGELYHEFIVYSNLDGVEPGSLPITEEDKADLVEENIVGEAAYATPPIVPSDREPGDADHHIRGGGWGAELTVELEAGEYILLCDITGHYGTYKQYAAFTAE